MTKFIYKPRQVALWVWGVSSFFTLALYLFDMPLYPSRALPLIWSLYSWNFYAYAFDKRMWPQQFEELYGQGKGNPNWRSFWFWFSFLQYFGFLLVFWWHVAFGWGVEFL